MGSLQWATADFIANAKGDAAAKTEFIRFFTDKLTDKLISHGASKLPEGDVRTGGTAAANGFVDAIWEGITDWMASGEIARGDEVTGGTLDLARIFRDAMSEAGITGTPSVKINGQAFKGDLYSANSLAEAVRAEAGGAAAGGAAGDR